MGSAERVNLRTEIVNARIFVISGRKITQDGQRDLDRIAMTLAEESDEE